MPSNFWAKAINTSVYLLNRLPTKSLKNKTLYEAWNVKVDEMTTWDWQNKKDAHLMLASIIMKIFKLLNS